MQFAQGNNLPRVKMTNQAAILRMIYYYGPITRAEIADQLALTLPTITTNINSMMSVGILEEVGAPEKTKTMGRRANLVDIISSSKRFIGVEMRGTLRRLCVTDYRGNMIYTRRDETGYSDYEENIRVTCKLIREVLDQKELGEISGIGFCLPGLVDDEAGVLSVHPGYQWVNKPVGDDVRRLTGFEGPITISNNACARAFSAQLFERELLNHVPSFAYLYISMGIACPLIFTAPAAQGALVGEGEVGHMIMSPDGPACSCGNRGCLEAYASDRAIISRCLAAMNQGEADILKAGTAGAEPTIEEIMHACTLGDKAAKEVVHTAIAQLGIAIANVDNFVRPHSILIEGKLFSGNENRQQLLAVIDRNLYTATNVKTRFVFISPDEFSGARGGAAVAIRQDMHTYIEA